MIWVIVGGGCWCGLCRVVVEVVATAIGHVMGFSWIVIGLVTNHWAYQIPPQSPPKSHSPSPSLIWIHTFAAAKVGPAFIIISQCHHDFVKFQSLSSLSHVLSIFDLSTLFWGNRKNSCIGMGYLNLKNNTNINDKSRVKKGAVSSCEY